MNDSGAPPPDEEKKGMGAVPIVAAAVLGLMLLA
jgi:hypothetical protein